MKPDFHQTFRDPGPEFRSAPFWAWNAAIAREGVREQVPIFAEMGYGGFFIHSRPGLATPYLSREWFDRVRDAVEAAEKAGLKAWLYDEDRWPSGTAGGILTAERPDHAATELRAVRGAEPGSAPAEGAVLAWFAVRRDPSAPGLLLGYRRLRSGAAPLRRGEERLRVDRCPVPPDPWYNGGRYPDTLSREAVGHFVALTHERYARAVGGAFGGTVPGIFSDEACLFPEGWTDRLPAWFRRRFGYDPADRLPEIFFDVRGEAFSPFRLDYARCRTELFADAFCGTIGAWCARHGIESTGHLLAEDDLREQGLALGAAMPSYRRMQRPGIDVITRNWFVANTARQCVSAARQDGRRFRLVELHAATGWDFPLEGFKAIAEWLLALGVNFRVPHLAWYSMEGRAKRDYPGSLFRQAPWAPRARALEDRLARITAAVSAGRDAAELLVVHPMDSAQGLRLRARPAPLAALERDFVALTNELLAEKVDFDFGDEDALAARARVRRGGAGAPPAIRLGRGRYRAVALQPLLTIRSSTLRLLRAFAAAGGEVLFWGEPPARLDGRPSAAPARAFAAFRRVASAAALARAAAPSLARVRVRERGRTVRPALCLVNETPARTVLFVCNLGCEFPEAGRIMDIPPPAGRTLAFPGAEIALRAPAGRRVVELLPDDGASRPVPFRYERGAYRFAAPLAARESRLFAVERADGDASTARPQAGRAAGASLPSRGPYAIRLSEPNVLVLDQPVACSADGAALGGGYVLDLDDAVRARIGAPIRVNRVPQPWTTLGDPPGPSADVRLDYEIRCRVPPAGACGLALERAAAFSIELNGRPLRAAPRGWWVDPALPVVPVPAGLLRAGENRLALRLRYDARHPGLEACYLLGDFGVGRDGALAAPPRRLRPGDWTARGLLHYAGNVECRVPVPAAARRAAAAGARIAVRVPRFDGTAIEFAIPGGAPVFRGWPPYEAVFGPELADARELLVTLYGHRRNAFGPLHFGAPDPAWLGPNEMRAFREARPRVVPFGLPVPVVFLRPAAGDAASRGTAAYTFV